MPMIPSENDLLSLEPEPIKVRQEIPIPTRDRRKYVSVPALRDPATGEIYLDSDGHTIIEKKHARYANLLSPDQIKAVRKRLNLTQKEMCELLQIGLKTWSRWEKGYERPFRSTNVLLCALKDGKIDLSYLRSLSEETPKL